MSFGLSRPVPDAAEPIFGRTVLAKLVFPDHDHPTTDRTTNRMTEKELLALLLGVIGLFIFITGFVLVAL